MYLCMNAYVHTELQRRMFQPKQAQRTWRKRNARQCCESKSTEKCCCAVLGTIRSRAFREKQDAARALWYPRYMCDMTHFNDMCARPHSDVWYDLSLCVTWFVLMCTVFHYLVPRCAIHTVSKITMQAFFDVLMFCVPTHHTLFVMFNVESHSLSLKIVSVEEFAPK